MPKLSNYTVADIHHVIRDTNTLGIAAQRLKLTDSTVLTSHLGKFLLYGEPLNLDAFRALSVEDARKLWGEAYEQKIASPNIDISLYSASHIHQLACKTNTIRNLASSLGVRDHTVQRYLNKFKMMGETLTFERLKSLSYEDARQVFGNKYEALYPEQRINLTPDFLEPSIETPASVLAERHHCNSFNILAALFEQDFPLSHSLGLDVRVGNKRNMYELFSESCLTSDVIDKERPLKKNYPIDSDRVVKI